MFDKLRELATTSKEIYFSWSGKPMILYADQSDNGGWVLKEVTGNILYSGIDAEDVLEFLSIRAKESSILIDEDNLA
jgi:hypothetical protein